MIENITELTLDELKAKFTKGRFGSVLFTKKNGEERLLVGKVYVNKDIKGTGSYDAAAYNQLRVFDVNIKDKGVRVGGWRTVCVDSVKEIHANGNVYRIG